MKRLLYICTSVWLGFFSINTQATITILNCSPRSFDRFTLLHAIDIGIGSCQHNILNPVLAPKQTLHIDPLIAPQKDCRQTNSLVLQVIRQPNTTTCSPNISFFANVNFLIQPNGNCIISDSNTCE